MVDDNGVRYTAFSDLPYWQPIVFPTIDIMHCLILGLLKDLSTTYLGFPAAGKKLQAEQAVLATNGIYTTPNPPHQESDQPPSPSQSMTMDLDQHSALPTSSVRTNPSRAARSSHSGSRFSCSQGSHVSNVSHGTDASTSTIQATKQAKAPTITPHELSLIHTSIFDAKVPTWLTRVPSKIGMPTCGTPKAAEWLILYTVYLVFSLVPSLRGAEPQSNSHKIYHAMILEIQIINISVSRVLSENDIEDLASLLAQYRHHLQDAWSSIKSKPNLHYAQHLPQQCRLFGPPSYTAAWPGERVIGNLVKRPKNPSPGKFPFDLSHIQAARTQF